jgi:hypothetical protein
MKCPGQDTRYWKPGDIFTIKCPSCDAELEFFKDDTTRLCEKCGFRFFNPKLDLGCLKHCKFADKCVKMVKDERDRGVRKKL